MQENVATMYSQKGGKKKCVICTIRTKKVHAWTVLQYSSQRSVHIFRLLEITLLQRHHHCINDLPITCFFSLFFFFAWCIVTLLHIIPKFINTWRMGVSRTTGAGPCLVTWICFRVGYGFGSMSMSRWGQSWKSRFVQCERQSSLCNGWHAVDPTCGALGLIGRGHRLDYNFLQAESWAVTVDQLLMWQAKYKKNRLF